jgi:nicotinamide-nucleotide amidase
MPSAPHDPPGPSPGPRPGPGADRLEPSRLAAIVAVGSELLGSDRLDTNSLRLTEVLERHGYELRRKVVVGDDPGEIAGILRQLAEEHSVVLVTGGLGPTADDVTREAAAVAFGRTLTEDGSIVRWLEERFRAYGREMPAVNRRQAMVPDGDAEVLANRQGSAPGLRFDTPGGSTFLFPGVPRELEGMIEEHFEPWLSLRSGGGGRERVVLRTAGLPESEVEERIAPAYAEFGREAITVLAGAGEVQVRGVAAGPEGERRALLSAIEARLAELLGEGVYSHREDETLEAVVGRLLAERGQTLVTAESCTGGLLAERITRVPGSSAWFLGGAVSYSNALKTDLLGVPESLLAEHGAVSEPVARAMAEGARRRLGADWAVAITGIAGPDGGSDEKPVGTVDLAWAGPDGETVHRRRRFLADRDRVRALSALTALEWLRRRLLAGPRAEDAESTP